MEKPEKRTQYDTADRYQYIKDMAAKTSKFLVNENLAVTADELNLFFVLMRSELGFKLGL